MDIGYGPDRDAARPDALTSYSVADWQIVAADRRCGRLADGAPV
jgi:hypothetical protein